MTTHVGSGEVERFRGIVAAHFGLEFDDSKLGFLAGVLRKRVETVRRNSEDYLAHLENGGRHGEEAGALAQELTVGETYFFRNNDQFRALTEVALPRRMRERGGDRRLNLLSAGCASGEEPYSLAMVLKGIQAASCFDVHIRAVDINPAALARAMQARFSPWALRETPSNMEKRWFRPAGRELMLDEEICSAIQFEQRNLAIDDPDLWRPDFYDVVFCRNVLMYFSPDRMRTAVDRIAQSLVPGGYLFLGHAETLRGLSQDFHLLHTHETFYYQRRRIGDDADLPPSLPRLSSASRPPEPMPLAGSWVDVIGGAAERIRALDAAPPAEPSVPLVETRKWDLAKSLELLGRERFGEALDVVRALPPEAARDGEVLLLTAVLLTHSGELAAGAEVAGRLLSVDEMNAGARYVLALCCEGTGDRAAASHQYKLAVYLDSDFAMPRLHLGLLAKRTGDLATARRELSQALLLLQREEPSRLILFGGGFTREGLISLARAELASIEGRP